MLKEKERLDSEIDPFDLPAPQWVTKIAYFFRLGLGLFLALSIASSLILSGCSARASEFWSPAVDLLNRDQISAIIADSSSFTLSNIPDEWIKGMRAHEEDNFYLIDFNNKGLCGSGGCLYVGYLLDEDAGRLTNVLSIRVKPELPRGVPLFEIDRSREEQPPCLKVHELADFKKLFLHTFCFNGTEYVKESTIAQPIPAHAN